MLLIDDQDFAADLVATPLQECEDIRVHHEPDATRALRTALEMRPSVVLVDLVMPLMDGYAVIRQFRAHPEMRHLPMILLSSNDSAQRKVQGFAEGANDYLVKWPSMAELIARVRYHAAAWHARCERDEAFRKLEQSRLELLARTEELAASRAALHHLQKLEAVGQLTGGVAHDFNNVLQIISGNLQLLRMETKGQARAQTRIDSALDGVRRGAKLASQLLSFARRQPLQPVAVNSSELVANMEEMLRHTLGSSTDIELELAADAGNIFVDPSQLENVLLNLAINGRDAMSGPGLLRLRTANVELDEPRSGELAPGSYVQISVQDSGAGMPPNVLERVFEPFFTTKAPGEGTGLGLSMAYGFVKQSGGHIEIESEPGRGTAVHIWLPRTPLSAEGQSASHAGPVLKGDDEIILVVEDEAEVRRTTVELLRRLGYRTLEAENALMALEILNRGARVDLLFTDVIMPGPLESMELARMARQLLPGIKVLFASGYAQGAMAHGGARLEQGVTLLSKPYTDAELSARIASMLESRAPGESGMADTTGRYSGYGGYGGYGRA